MNDVYWFKSVDYVIAEGDLEDKVGSEMWVYDPS